MQQLVRRVKLVKIGSSTESQKDMGVRFPSSLALAIRQSGYTHCDLYLTDDGILLKPVIDPLAQSVLGPLQIPDWQ